MAHPNFPFADFASNDVSFLMAELYWRELFRSVMGERLGDWTPIEPAARDGNPMFAAYSPAAGRALRIIQKTNENKKPEYPNTSGEAAYYPVQPWCNKSLTPDGDQELLELVIYSDCSNFSETINRQLITRHCIDQLPVEELERLIRAYENRVGMAD